ncbi:hypothetical protein AQUCO_00500640v1 [Aquilegia coerulea]|uniref:Pentacotripeptide-repeat region of PRORP domain-containing protein n=1 Tax=Aquilegia coerulea TaxID=218851 RepID=A0A2G5ESV5_AQUCA|nr:hypothetical protein AQUCO_00500640v1 [Aquilegia coerulea]
MIVTGIFSSGDSNGKLIASYARLGDIVSARQVFDEIPEPKRGIPTWNAMIIAYSKVGSSNQVLNLYRSLLLGNGNGIGGKPDSTTFTITIKACANLMDLRTGEEVGRNAVEFGYKDDVFVGSSLVNLYAKCGKMEKAMKVFDDMPKRDLVTWTTMVSGYAQTGKSFEAIEIYREMQRGNVKGDEIVMVSLIQSCSNIGDVKLGQSVHGYMIRREVVMDVVTETSLVDMYAKNGLLKLALCVFDRMSYRNVVSWSALISGFAQNGFAWDAFRLFVEMQKCRFKPDHMSLVSVLVACSHVGFSKFGKSIHGYIVRSLEFDQILGTAVIDMYSKCGSLLSARVLFDGVNLRDLISWNAMIAIYGIHGYGKEALLLFLQMKQSGLKPDHATFASLLSALSHSGLVEEGLYWFDLMSKEFSIHPSEKHYACMIDLLARAGRVEEAYKMIDSMDVEPGVTIWVALLAGCSNHGKLDLGLRVAKKVLDLRPDDPGIYTLVSNVCAAAKNWDEVATVRKVMKKSGLKKVPGYSVVEVNNSLHTFLMEDKSHPHLEKMLTMLKWLDLEMRAINDMVMKTEFYRHDLREEDVV